MDGNKVWVPAELETYLRDHYAGSAGGSELCRRIADSAGGEEEAREVRAVAEDIAVDQEALENLMSRMGVRPSRLKAAGGWLGEKAGRLKLRAASPAGRVLQYEAMIMGVTGKLHLWLSLQECADRLPEAEASELENLVLRADDQRAVLLRWHQAAAERLT